MISSIIIKKDKALFAFAAVLVVAVAALVVHGDVTWKEAGAFMLAAFALPGFFGSKPTSDPDDEDEPRDPPAGGATPLIVGACLLLAACGAPSTETKQAEAEGAYGAALMACVDDAGTLAASKACRARVDLAWGVHRPGTTMPPSMFIQPPTFIDGGARDAGAEGGTP